MTLLTEESVCWDCRGRDTCMRLKRLSPGKSIRDELESLYDSAKNNEIDTSTLLYRIDGEYKKRNKEIFEILIVNCSMKVQYIERERMANEAANNPEERSNLRYLFYCPMCNKMHINGSGIGKEHNDIINKKRQEEINKNVIEPERKSKNNIQKI